MRKKRTKCSAWVKPVPTLGRGARPCSRTASVWRDGQPYCKIHDPEYKKPRKPLPEERRAERYNYLAGRLLRRHGFTIDDLVWNKVKVERIED